MYRDAAHVGIAVVGSAKTSDVCGALSRRRERGCKKQELVPGVTPNAGEDEAIDRVLPHIPGQSTNRSEEEVLHAGFVRVDAVGPADVVEGPGVADRGLARRSNLPLRAVCGCVGHGAEPPHPVPPRVLIHQRTLLGVVLLVDAAGHRAHHGMADVVDTEGVVILPPRPAIVLYAILILCPEVSVGELIARVVVHGDVATMLCGEKEK